MRIELWADVVCPWCCIGTRQLELALAEWKQPVEVVHRAFELDPRQSHVEKTTEMLARKYRRTPAQVTQMLAHVEGVAAELGLEYHLDRTLVGNTIDAHRVLKLAHAQGKGEQAWARAYRWYFTEGRSLFDHESLRAFATELALAEVDEVLASRRYADEVAADERRAHEIGVQGVPFFVFADRLAVEGAQPAELLLQALTQAAG